MYTVHMPRHAASAARRQLFHLLDAAERGEEVIVERRGVRFRLTRESDPPPAPTDEPLLVCDPALLDGQWTWSPDGALVLPDPA